MFLTYLTMDACYWQEDVRQNSQSSDLTAPCICWPESSQHHVFALPGRACNMAWEDVDAGGSSHAKVIKSLILLARVAILEMSGVRRNGESCGMICSKLTYKREKCLKSIQKKSMIPILCGSQRPAMLVKLLKSKNLALTNVINVQEWKWQVARSWDALPYESQWAWNTEEQRSSQGWIRIACKTSLAVENQSQLLVCDRWQILYGLKGIIHRTVMGLWQ